jgi:ATP cone domain
MSASPGLPPWVKKRDGRVVPFDPDAIGKDLFSAAEALGRADPFLTRELTDGVLHFLAADCPESIPSTQWIADLVVKVVRELRQPRLAQAFAERARAQAAPAQPPPQPRGKTPLEVVRRSLESYSLETVFSRDLAAAHRDGLLALAGLEAPRELAAAVLTTPEPSATLQALQLLDAVLEAREGVAGWLALDGAECLELEKGSPPLPRLLMPVLQAAGLTARLHLNAADLPHWAMPAAHGPLFADQVAAPPEDVLHAAASVVQAVLALERSRCPFAIDWHLGERDFAADSDVARGDLLESMVRAALGEYPVTFVFDRPRRPLSLGPGLDRLHSYVLMAVGLDLPRLLEYTGITDDVELFLRKVASLARLAVSAGVQKRNFLRESLHDTDADRSFLQRGFLLDRARLMVTPLGLDRSVRTLTGSGLYEDKAGLDLARRILQRLKEVLFEESSRRLVDCVLDASEGPAGGEPSAPARQQLAVAGCLHGVTGAGTAIAACTEDERLCVDHVVRLLEFAWRQTEVARLQFQPRPRREREPLLLI